MRRDESCPRSGENDGLGSVNGVNDFIGIERTRGNVSRRDTAFNSLAQSSDDSVRNSAISRRVADEDVGRADAGLLLATALGHFRCPRHLCGIVADAFGVSNLGEFASENDGFRAANSMN